MDSLKSSLPPQIKKNESPLSEIPQKSFFGHPFKRVYQGLNTYGIMSGLANKGLEVAQSGSLFDRSITSIRFHIEKEAPSGTLALELGLGIASIKLTQGALAAVREGSYWAASKSGGGFPMFALGLAAVTAKIYSVREKLAKVQQQGSFFEGAPVLEVAHSEAIHVLKEHLGHLDSSIKDHELLIGDFMGAIAEVDTLEEQESLLKTLAGLEEELKALKEIREESGHELKLLQEEQLSSLFMQELEEARLGKIKDTRASALLAGYSMAAAYLQAPAKVLNFIGIKKLLDINTDGLENAQKLGKMAAFPFNRYLVLPGLSEKFKKLHHSVENAGNALSAKKAALNWIKSGKDQLNQELDAELLSIAEGLAKAQDVFANLLSVSSSVGSVSKIMLSLVLAGSQVLNQEGLVSDESNELMRSSLIPIQWGLGVVGLGAALGLIYYNRSKMDTQQETLRVLNEMIKQEDVSVEEKEKARLRLLSMSPSSAVKRLLERLHSAEDQHSTLTFLEYLGLSSAEMGAIVKGHISDALALKLLQQRLNILG